MTLLKNKKKFVIIGAGISGLTLACELKKKNQDVIILEKLNFPGGLTRTEYVDGINYDCGPHLYHTNNKDIKEYWFRLFKKNVSSPKLFGANYKNGKFYEYPVSKESLVKQFPKDERLKIIKELEGRNLEDVKSAKNYHEFVTIIAGKTLSEIFFTKYPKKLWGINPDKLSAKFAPRRVEIRDDSRPFHSGKNKWAGVLKNGCGTLAKSLEIQLNSLGAKIDYESELKKIKKDNNVITELVFNNKTIKVNPNDVVISTVPITNLAKLLKIKHSLWNRSLKIACFVTKKIILHKKYSFLYFDDPKIFFHRISLLDDFAINNSPKGKSILSCEVSYKFADKIDKLTEKKILDRCKHDLICLNIIGKKEKIFNQHLINAGPVYPGIETGYEEKLSKIKSGLEKFDNLHTHGSLAEFEYADTQILTAKSIDLANILLDKDQINLNKLYKTKPNQEITIQNTKLGNNNPTYVIAEAGLNHNGDLKNVYKLIDLAKKAGAQAIKLQTYKKGRISKKVRTSRYYEDLVESQDSLSNFIDNIRFSKSDLKEVFKYAMKKKITLFSTPFDFDSLKELESLGCPAYKISSMDLVNIPLIKEVAKMNKPMILSTGMSQLSDIENAVNTVLQLNNSKIIVLHCVSSYPCDSKNANLPKISDIKRVLKVIPGYSDHTLGTDIAIASIAMGAKVIEKHFTLDKNMDGPDHSFSLNFEELNQLIKSIRNTENAMQSIGFGIQNCEMNTAQNLRRSIFTKKIIKKGEKITTKNIEIKSPGIGIDPKYFEKIIDKKINKTLEEDLPLTWNDI